MSFEAKTTVCLYKRKYCHHCPFREDNYCNIFTAYLGFGSDIRLGYRRCFECLETEKKHKEKKINNTQIK